MKAEQRVEKRSLDTKEGVLFFQESFRQSQGDKIAKPELQYMLFEMMHRLHPEIELGDNQSVTILNEAIKRFRPFLPPSNLEIQRGAQHQGATQHVKIRTPQLVRESTIHLGVLQTILNDRTNISFSQFPEEVNDAHKEKLMDSITSLRKLSTWRLTWKMIHVMTALDKYYITRPDGRIREPKESKIEANGQPRADYPKVPALDRRLSFVKYYLIQRHNTSSALMNEVLEACRKQYPLHVLDITQLIRTILKGKNVERQRVRQQQADQSTPV